MIRNDEEMAVVRKQLALAEDALAALRRDVLPKNARNYQVLSESYIDQIAALRAEIDVYLGIPLAPIEPVQAAGDMAHREVQ